MRDKKGRNFKEVIEAEKNKGRATKRIMHAITSLNVSLLYGGSFLFLFVVLASIFYFALSPSVFLWAGVLVVAALVSSLFASRITNMLKNNQWKYSS